MSNYFKKEFFETLLILKNYLSDFVIAGGWAPLIYYHYLLSDKTREPLRTKDIDIVVPAHLKKRKDRTVDEILTEAGFESQFRSRHVPPVLSYEGKIGNFEVEIEFLTHRKGARDGQVAVVQEGLHAQLLRFIIILLENSITVDIDEFKLKDNEFLKIRVPTPRAFIFQKGLIFTRRTTDEKKSKDLYYIFDILSNCEELKTQLLKDISNFKESYPLSWSKQFINNLKVYFPGVDGDGVLMVQSQKPENAYPDMNDEQFCQYVFGIFQEFIDNL